MKKLLNLVIALLLPAALCLPASAQDEEAAAPKEETSSDVRPMVKPAAKPAAKAAGKKAAAKKKAPKKKKKKPVKPVSEYKFTSADPVTDYKFDKQANPIKKAPPKKKKGAKPAVKKPAADDSKYIAEEGATKPPEEAQ